MNPPFELRGLIEVAAYRRAAGAQWKAIAAEIGRSERTLQRWPLVYSDFWDQCFQVGIKKFLSAIVYEAIVYELKHMRGENLKVSQSASQFLIRRIIEVLIRAERVLREPFEPKDDGFFQAAAHLQQNPNEVLELPSHAPQPVELLPAETDPVPPADSASPPVAQ